MRYSKVKSVMRLVFKKEKVADQVAEFLADVIGITVVTAWVVFIAAWTLNLMGVIVW
jgi:hypothetical protein